MEWNPEKFIFEDYIQLSMVITYMFINIGIGVILERANQKLILLGCVAMVAIESILVITSDYSQLFIILLFSVSFYIFIMGWAQKTLPRFNLFIAFLLLIIFIFLMMIITLIIY